MTSAVKICHTIGHVLMNVRQKMLECPTKCPTDNKKNWWMKRSETQMTVIKDSK